MLLSNYGACSCGCGVCGVWCACELVLEHDRTITFTPRKKTHNWTCPETHQQAVAAKGVLKAFMAENFRAEARPIVALKSEFNNRPAVCVETVRRALSPNASPSPSIRLDEMLEASFSASDTDRSSASTLSPEHCALPLSPKVRERCQLVCSPGEIFRY